MGLLAEKRKSRRMARRLKPVGWNYVDIPTGGAEIGGGGFTGGSDFEVTKAFNFNAGDCIQYYYTVYGRCMPYKCVVWTQEDWQPYYHETTGTEDCDRRLVLTIMGCNLREVCQKIADRGLQLVIDKIYKYSEPASVAERNATGPCGQYFEIYPENQEDGNDQILPVECLQLLYSGGAEEDWGMSFEVEWAYAEEGEGGIVVNGDADIIVSSYDIEGDGGIDVGGVAITSANYLGEFTTSGSLTDEVIDLESTFNEYGEPDVLEASTDQVGEACSCGPFPLIVQVTHNFNDSSKLFSFLKRNGLQLPKTVYLIYNTVTFSWQANYHYSGYGDVNRELWDILFEFQCTDQIGETFANLMWKFSFYARRVDTVTGQKQDTRIVLALSPGEVCEFGYGLRYAFHVNTRTKEVFSRQGRLNVNVDLNVCYDDLFLFATDDWLDNPILNIGIFQSDVARNSLEYPINRLLPDKLIFNK